MQNYVEQARSIKSGRSWFPQSRRNGSHRVKTGYKKYHNHVVTFDGKTFDSKTEMRFYLKLKSQVQNKQILEFECQPKIELFPDPIVTGRMVTYIPDFRVVRNDGTEFFVDVKGEATAEEAVYRLKIKCVKHFFPKLELHECVYGRNGIMTENVY